VDTNPTIRFRGTPTSLVAAAGLSAPAGLHRIQLSKGITGAADAIEANAVAVDADPILRLHLPRTTPPGAYEGRMVVGDREQTVQITVEPDVFFRIMPERLIFTAKAEEPVTFDLVFANLGNVAIDIADVYAFGVFDVGGTERAIGRMMLVKSDGSVKSADQETPRRIDVLADAIADEHGGLVRVKVNRGAGTLAPGATRDVAITLRAPERLRSGHTYWGTWPIYNNRYYVKITGA
jgi:hypothetical protein